jgi:hypothetical protein
MTQFDPNSLKAHEGSVLELRFSDGYAAVVRLLDVSEEHEDSDLVYDVLEVLNWGPVDPATVDLTAAHAAASRDLVAVVPRPGYTQSSRPPA